MASGMLLIWARAERVAGPILTRPAIVTFEARVERVEPLPPRQLVRLRLAPHVDRFVALDNEMILKHGMQKRGGVGNAGNARAYERG